jgi:uncharacterized membrane protein YphA (DoxX/SURF4 family)
LALVWRTSLVAFWLWASVAVVVELGGSLLVILGFFVSLGAGALGVSRAFATLVANDFWTMVGHDRFMALNIYRASRPYRGPCAFLYARDWEFATCV